MNGIGPDFYEETKYSPGVPPDYGEMPSAPLGEIGLPKPAQEGGTLAKLLASRRSRRKFAGQPISIDDLSFLLWACDGVSESGKNPAWRTAPSAGRMHPIDTWVVVLRVDGLESGIYRYVPASHSLELFRKGNYEEATVKAAAGQEWIHGAAAVFIWIAEFARTTTRYKDRGYRYVFLDAGHICQNLYLAVESLSLGMTAIAALVDDEVNALVGADGEERSILYMAALGKPVA